MVFWRFVVVFSVGVVVLDGVGGRPLALIHTSCVHSAGLPPEVGGPVVGNLLGQNEKIATYFKTPNTHLVFSLCPQSTKTIVGCRGTISIMC